VGLGQPENTCQPSKIVDCLTQWVGDWPRVHSKKRKTKCVPARKSLLGPKWLIGCSPSASPVTVIRLVRQKERKKERKGTRRVRVCSKKRETPCPPVRNSFLGLKWLIRYSPSA